MPRTKKFVPLPEVIPSGMVIDPSHPASALPLEKTAISGQVTGSLAVISVTQYFSNPLTKITELEYLYPLPHKAAIVDFELRIADRIIRGDLREMEKARQDYEEAVMSGQQAALMEERRPNLFAVRIANVRPGEAVQSSIHYQETIAYRDGEYELVIPMGLTPRYSSPSHPEESVGVDAPIALPGERIGPVELSLAIDAGTTLEDPSSPSHALRITRLDERRLMVTLANPTIPDHDFVLRLPVAKRALNLTSFLSKHEGGDVFIASILPPAMNEDELEPFPREFIFVLDRSGSMSGGPIAQARNALRACLRTLNLTDTFNILLFDDEIEWYQKDSLPVNQDTINSADQFLAEVEGRGGTEIMAAIDAALDLPSDEKRIRYVVFLTDGAVSAEERALAKARKKLGNARFFTFGIGPSVNRALLQKLASVGRGTCEFLQLDEDIEGTILRFQDRVSFPAVTDLKFECQNGKVWDSYPSFLPDVYAGSPLEIVGRIKVAGNKIPRLVIRGLRQGQPVELAVDLAPLPAPDPAVLRAWARARVDDLEEQADSFSKPMNKVRDEIINLALEFRLVTRYTSFVAIDSAIVNKDGKPGLVRVAQPLPEGLDLAGFMRLASPAMNYQITAPSALPRASKPGIQEDFMMAMIEIPNDNDQSVEAASWLRVVPSFLPKDEPGFFGKPDQLLRWLARTQNLDGSWSNSVEFNALALLFFVRHGYTTHQGYYRKQVKRALHWVSKAKLTGIAAFVATLAAHELAGLTGLPEHSSLAQQLVANLATPATVVEETILALIQNQVEKIQIPKTIQHMDELRLASLLKLPLQVPDSLDQQADRDLVGLWSALM